VLLKEDIYNVTILHSQVPGRVLWYQSTAVKHKAYVTPVNLHFVHVRATKLLHVYAVFGAEMYLLTHHVFEDDDDHVVLLLDCCSTASAGTLAGWLLLLLLLSEPAVVNRLV
jgi:hypothetical protein